MSRRSRAGLAAAVATGACGYLALLLSETYGVVVFLICPLLIGMTAVAAASRIELAPMRADLRLAAWTSLVPYVLAFLGGIEGAVCLLIFLPLAIPMSLAGAVIAHRVAGRRGLMALMALPPILGSAEANLGVVPEVVPVSTSIEIAAPPSVVWRNIMYTELPPPDEWLFRAGIAYPVRAEIEGSVRRCHFSNGVVVEPITAWQEPRLLEFRVSSQPPTMSEMSPWDIEPPHLEGYFIAHGGRFELTPLSGGRTLLTGTSWYSNRMWPAPYWRLWSDHVMHTIHNRVFRHIRARSEAG